MDTIRESQIEWSGGEWKLTQVPFPTDPACEEGISIFVKHIPERR